MSNSEKAGAGAVKQAQAARKFYSRTAFVLDDRKLSRLVEIASERLARSSSGEVNALYTVTFADGKVVALHSLSDVLALDNTVHNPITILDVEAFTWGGEGERSASKSDYRVAFVFEGDGSGREIVLYAGSLDSTWLMETLGAMEEQAERCRPSEVGYWLKLRSGSIGFISSLIVLVGVLFAVLVSMQRDYIPKGKREALLNIASAAHSDSEKVDFIFRLLREEATVASPQDVFDRYATNPHTYFVVVPALIALLAAWTAVARYYPQAVFAWGDVAERYAKQIERRKVLWYAVLVSLAVGVLGNIFVLGVSGFIK